MRVGSKFMEELDKSVNKQFEVEVLNFIRRKRSKSLNPSDAQIRAWEIEETLRRTRKTTGELFPNAGDLHAYLSKPVNKIKYYQIARCRVKHKTA